MFVRPFFPPAPNSFEATTRAQTLDRSKKSSGPSRSSPHPLRHITRSTLSLPNHDITCATTDQHLTHYDDDFDDVDVYALDDSDFRPPVVRTRQLRAATTPPRQCETGPRMRIRSDVTPPLESQVHSLDRNPAFRRRPLLNSFYSNEELDLLQFIRSRKEELVQEIYQLRMEIEDVDDYLEGLSVSSYSAESFEDPSLESLESSDVERMSNGSFLSHVHKKSNKLQLGRKKFNMDPKKGIEFLVQEELLDDSPEAISQFLFRGEGLNKGAIGDYLGEYCDMNLKVLDQFLLLHEFHDMILVQSLRQFLWSFRLPGEAQKIDRMMEAFAKRYCDCNPSVFSPNNVDTCYVISFAVIMLNTSLHNPNIKESQRQSLDQFIAMNKGINGGEDLRRDLLVDLYENIKKEPFKIPLDDSDDLVFTFFNPDKEGWLLKQGGRVKSWKRRWFILNDNCLYYFEYTTDKEPRGIIPLENLQVREVNDKSKKFCFELYPANADIDKIKACKTTADGKLIEGRHKVYRISATSWEDRLEWMKVIRASIAQNPFLDFLVERKKSIKAQNHKWNGSHRTSFRSATPSPAPTAPTAPSKNVFSSLVSRLSVDRS